MTGKSLSGKKVTPAMSIRLELCFTEEHDSHLQDEADRDGVFILFLHEVPVKGVDGQGVISGNYLAVKIVRREKRAMRKLFRGCRWKGE